MRILVVEDEKRLAQNLQELLRREGYTVCFFNNSSTVSSLSTEYGI